MQIEADLRKDKSPSFICTVSLCQRQGDETVKLVAISGG